MKYNVLSKYNETLKPKRNTKIIKTQYFQSTCPAETCRGLQEKGVDRNLREKTNMENMY